MWFVCSLCGAQHRPVYSLRYSKWPVWNPARIGRREACEGESVHNTQHPYKIDLPCSITTERAQCTYRFVCVGQCVTRSPSDTGLSSPAPSAPSSSAGS
jgi:hypothetical protein